MLLTAQASADTGVPEVGYGPLVADPAKRLWRCRGLQLHDRHARRRHQAGDGRAHPAEPRRHRPRSSGRGRHRAGQQPRDRRRRARPACPAGGPDLRPGRRRRHHHHRGRPRRRAGRASTSAWPAPHNNCAGGSTPWDTWLTCEETEARPADGFQKDHGYVFEVDPYDRSANRDPKPIKALGRYAHEAVVVDPHSRRDLPDRGRERPERAALPLDPAAAASARGRGALRDARRRRGGDAGTPAGAELTRRRHARRRPVRAPPSPAPRYGVDWVDVPDRDADDASRPASSSPTARSPAAASSEGTWWADGGAYFVASFARADDGSADAARRPGLVLRPARRTRSRSSCASA